MNVRRACMQYWLASLCRHRSAHLCACRVAGADDVAFRANHLGDKVCCLVCTIAKLPLCRLHQALAKFWGGLPLQLPVSRICKEVQAGSGCSGLEGELARLQQQRQVLNSISSVATDGSSPRFKSTGRFDAGKHSKLPPVNHDTRCTQFTQARQLRCLA